jgi:hypothetical protein
MVKVSHLGNYQRYGSIYNLGRSPFLDAGLRACAVREGECRHPRDHCLNY